MVSSFQMQALSEPGLKPESEKKWLDSQRMQALDELAAGAQELNMGYD